MPTAAPSRSRSSSPKSSRPKKPSAPLGTIDPIVALALSGLKAPEHVREQVQAGIYTFDAMLRVTGEITVAADTEAIQANKVDPWTLLVLALDRLPGVAIDQLVDQAEALLARKETGEDVGALHDAAIDAAKTTAQEAIDRIKGQTKAPRKGAVSVSCVVVALRS
jgi:hypothetical protein